MKSLFPQIYDEPRVMLSQVIIGAMPLGCLLGPQWAPAKLARTAVILELIAELISYVEEPEETEKR